MASRRADTFSLPLGHDHFNFGFSELGEYVVTYQVSGQLIASGATVSAQFDVSFLLR
jgi:surface-anchored protein